MFSYNSMVADSVYRKNTVICEAFSEIKYDMTTYAKLNLIKIK